MLHTKYQDSRPYGFRQEDFFYIFPYISLCKTCDPAANLFWPQGYNLNKLGRGPLGDATYQISRLWALWFQRRRFFFNVFPYISLWKQCDPGAGPFSAKGHNFNKLGRGPLGNATY